MYAEIHSKTEVNGEPLSKSGKRTWVNDKNPKMTLMKDSPDHLNKPLWHIQIDGFNSFYEDYESYKSEDLYVERSTVRTLTVELTPADFLKLINLAMPLLIEGADLQARKKMAFDILQGFEDADLLSFLAELLPSRPSTRV